MSLEAIQVYDNWEERAQLQQHVDERRWRAALCAVACSVALAVLIQGMAFLPDGRRLLVDGAAFSLCLTVGAWANGARARGRVLLFSCVYAVLLTAILLGGVAAQRVTAAPDSYHTACLVLCWTAMTVLGLVVLIYSLVTDPSEALRRGLPWGWWWRVVLLGLSGGAFVSVYTALSAHFSGLDLTPSQTPTLLFAHQVVYALAIRCAGEELVFRGAILQILFKRRLKGFWSAISISLPLNLAMYVVTMPSIRSPGMLAILLLGPSMMIIVNSALYLRRRTLLSPLICNGIFQVASLAMGLR